MKRKAQISIRSHQYIDGDVSRSESFAEGVATISDNSVFLSYSDDLGEGTKTECEIIFDRKSLIINRTGCVKTTLRIEENICNKGLYRTLYGEFPVEITGRKLDSDDKPDKLEITAYYYLVLGGGEGILNKVKITVWYGDIINE